MFQTLEDRDERSTRDGGGLRECMDRLEALLRMIRTGKLHDQESVFHATMTTFTALANNQKGETAAW
jgi:hypothetical protein